MKRFRRSHKRSKSASSIEGHPQAQKHTTGSKLSSNSYSSTDGDGSIRDDMSVEVGQSFFGRATARPLEDLPTEKIIKENKPSKIRSLSIIARLLRREGLPFLRNAHKQKKMLDSNRQKNTSISIEADRSSMKQKEFKDVYPDLETSSFVSGHSSPSRSSSGMLTKSEMALIQQNIDANRLTYDETISEKFLGSEELDDTLDMQDSRLKLMPLGIKQNSFINHVYDQQGTSSSSLGSCTPLLNLPSFAKYGNLNSKKLDRDTTGKHNITYNQGRDDGLLLDPHYCLTDCSSQSMSDIQLEEKNSKNILPAQIVVLSPNLGDRQNKDGSSPNHSQGCIPNSRKNEEYPSVGSEDDLSLRTSKSYHDDDFLKPEYSRKLANKITRRLRDACDNSEDEMCSGFGGSLVDESLYDVRETDLDSELEMFERLSRSSVADDDKRGRHPSSMLVHEEAKKRLAERWKVTHRYQDLEKVGKVSTLGEIISCPNGEKKSKETTDGCIGKSSSKVGIDNGCSVLHGLLGTVSRGDVKDKSERTSRSVSPIGWNIHGKGTCRDILPTEKHLLHGEPKSHGTSKVTRQYSNHKDHFSSQGSKFKSKPLPCPPIHIEKTGSSSEARFKIEMEANDKVPYRKLMFQMVEEEDDHSGSDVSEMGSTKHGITTLFSSTSLLHPKHSSADDERSSSTAHDQNDFHLQELHQGASDKGDPSLKYFGDKSVSLESSKDADYASPVSVLEVPSVEDASSISESVERVNGELSELRMQLQLLKMEYDACDDKSTHFLIGKDTVQSSSRAKGWEASYMLDVLFHSGLEDFGFDSFRIMWHTPDCPLESWLFDKLEEKYCNEISGSRPERRLLFDRINSALSEIFLKHVDVRPWVMPHLARTFHLTRQKERARDNVEKLMIGQESAIGLHVSKIMLDMDKQWNPTEEIALFGNKIEELLIDDMIDEFLLDLSW